LLGCVSFARDPIGYASFLGLVSFDCHPRSPFFSHRRRTLLLLISVFSFDCHSRSANNTHSLLRSPRQPTPFAAANCAHSEDRALLKDRYGEPERGGSEWELIKILLEGDGNSNKMKSASNTRLRLTTQVGQAHVATGVPLDQGTNTQPSDPRTQRNTKPQVYRPTVNTKIW
jgi:hypothetical protein